jgi:cytoskeleton protein RodZ
MALPDQVPIGEHDHTQPHAVNTGAELREARERHGLSLDQLSQTTKITVKILRSIETNQLEKLPEPVFLRGFLRAYAHEVGLDPAETVEQYLSQFRPPAETSEMPLTANEARGAPHGPSEHTNDTFAGMKPVPAAQALITILVVAAAFGMIRWAAHVRRSDQVATPAQTSQPASRDAAVAGHAEVGTSGSSTHAANTTVPAGFRMVIQAQGPCWISATVDGATVMRRLMQPREAQALDVHEEAVLRVGDPGAVAFSINGAHGRSLGRAGEAVTVRVTKQNYREFLASKDPLATTGR